MESEVNFQREWFKSRGSDVPLWHRQNLSIEETAAYTGIGRDTIYKLIKQEDCNFTLRVGKRTMIKRKRFEKYLEKTLDELRYKEEQIEKDKKDGIKAEARYTTLNDMYELWAIEEAILMTRLSIREIMHKCGEFRRDGINAIDLL